MADDTVSAELMAMREQLQRLEQARNLRQQAADQPAVAEPPRSTAEARETTATNETTGAGTDKDWLDELKELEGLEPEQVLERIKDSTGEWLGELNEELKDIKPSTLLLVFGLGVLVGRLT